MSFPVTSHLSSTSLPWTPWVIGSCPPRSQFHLREGPFGVHGDGPSGTVDLGHFGVPNRTPSVDSQILPGLPEERWDRGMDPDTVTGRGRRGDIRFHGGCPWVTVSLRSERYIKFRVFHPGLFTDRRGSRYEGVPVRTPIRRWWGLESASWDTGRRQWGCVGEGTSPLTTGPVWKVQGEGRGS